MRQTYDNNDFKFIDQIATYEIDNNFSDCTNIQIE